MSRCRRNRKPPPQDPWESWNRGVYNFNDGLDRAVAKPIARTYVRSFRRPSAPASAMFLSNLRMTTVMINDALQGKLGAAANDLARFLVNLTIGFGGLLDPATQMGLGKNDEDFGQTLGHWGVPPGPFLEMPVLAPRMRATARPESSTSSPARRITSRTTGWPGASVASTWSIRAPDLLSLDETLKKVYDPYAFIRDAYLQRRAYLVSDGKVTDGTLVDPGADEAPTSEPRAPPPHAATATSPSPGQT